MRRVLQFKHVRRKFTTTCIIYICQYISISWYLVLGFQKLFKTLEYSWDGHGNYQPPTLFRLLFYPINLKIEITNYLLYHIICRICHIKSCMLWSRTLQWDWTMYSSIQHMPKQRCICILGRFPSKRQSKQIDCRKVHDRIKWIHASNEPQYHYAFGFKDLIN